MLKDYQLRLFIRVISRRMEEEGKEFDDIIKGYPALSLEDKEKIKNTLCFKTFDNFKILHDKEIERIKNNNDRLIGSMGI